MTVLAYVVLLSASIIAAGSGHWTLSMAIASVTTVIAVVDLIVAVRALIRQRRARREARTPAGKRSVLTEVRR